MIKSLIIILTLVSIVNTISTYDQKWPNLGLSDTGSARYGPMIITTGLAYPDGIHVNAPYTYTETVKGCADHVIKSVHVGMASWTRRTKRCTLIYSDKTVEGDAHREYSRIYMLVQVGNRVEELDGYIKYFPRGQTSWTASNADVKGRKRFWEFLNKCDATSQGWVTAHGVPQSGWTCLNYVHDPQTSLIFVSRP